jgi:hypothetical protein
MILREKDGVSMESNLRIAVQGIDGKTRAEASGINGVSLTFTENFQEGDAIVVESSLAPLALTIRFDDILPAADIWLAKKRMEFPVPFGEELKAYAPGAFSGKERRLSAALTDTAVLKCCRNLSENPLDRRGETSYYPHCSATVETRGESVFAARNTIDGVIVPSGHGVWPYTSWGEGEDPGAEIKIEFGRTVFAGKVFINLRADFPHDNWWREAVLAFSDGSSMTLELRKTGTAQEFAFTPREMSWIKLEKLVRCESDPSPFPALTQWSVYGRDIL